MPDIQAGKVELTKDEVNIEKDYPLESSNQVKSFMRVDESGEPHDESVYNHLGRS